MDFFQICTKDGKREDKGFVEVYPNFTVGRSKDLMVRGKGFYAIYDEEKGLWSTDEYEVRRLVDEALDKHAKQLEDTGLSCKVKHLRSFDNGRWVQFRKFMNSISDNSHNLDASLTFADTEVKKTDYVSRRLPYIVAQGEHNAWDELINTLYSEEEKAKIEWGIGAVVSGDSKKIQKFLVFYGNPGSGKGTILQIIDTLFKGYTTTFDAKALVGSNNQFSTEPFKNNPLVAIQFDGDLSGIQDNTKLNSIISHEDMSLNEKYKPLYTAKFHSFLFMGSNKPVKITDAKSGLIRRLIDVNPSGATLSVNRYNTLMSKVEFELGAIAHHCLEVYRKMGKNYYSTYRPVVMMMQTDIFYNFVDANFDIFKKQNGATLKQAYAMYKEYCIDAGIEKPLPQYKVRAELTNYFEEFADRDFINGEAVRSYYSGFIIKPFKMQTNEDDQAFSLVMDETESILDKEYASQPAQYGTSNETPEKYWSDSPRMIHGELKEPKPNQIVSTTLSDLDTSKLHFVKPPTNHIVIDFDLTDEDGNKSLELNLKAASLWPATYSELSKSGNGIHNHYIYDGDTSTLSSQYAPGIEVKVYPGDASLRRRLSKCNNIPIATLSSGLPLKEKKVLQSNTITSEKDLRYRIDRNLRKEIHPGTKSSVDFINKILDDAYESGMEYDLSNLKSKLIAFANNSTNQALTCLKIVQNMKFKSDSSVVENKLIEPDNDNAISPGLMDPAENAPEVFYDVEVFPNLFVVCWKYLGDPNVVRMINPTPQEIERLLRFRLIGFRNRNYDNHMIYARLMGYNNEQIHKLSAKLIDDKDSSGLFGEAYNLSYADVYDFAAVKMSLKKWEIKLGIHHQELNIPWHESVPESRWLEVAEYCVNDVLATEAVYEARYQDFVARQILADLSGLPVNETTMRHAAKIIFKNDRHPQSRFVYTDLSKEFPGYVYDFGKSTYRDEVVGEGGYVYGEPGIYENVALLDVASMHPTTIRELNLFGEYTSTFWGLVEARLAVKRGEFDLDKNLLGGSLANFLGDVEGSKALAEALKLIINSVYGLTSAKFDNPFRDRRNKDNIVAKRGALFMIDLKHAIQEQGFTVAHIKTDSVKIPDATPEIIEFVKQFGEKYGYTFEYKPEKDHYDKLCLTNDAVYVARQDVCNAPIWVAVDETLEESDYISNVEKIENSETGEHTKIWTAVGAQFQHPYVFKTLFSHDDIEFDDLCETKAVAKGAMYLDFNADKAMALANSPSSMHFIGGTGRFIPVKEHSGGGILYRVHDDKLYAVAGTKDYFWLEAEIASSLEDVEIDMDYFEHLAGEAKKAIEKFGSFEEFVK